MIRFLFLICSVFLMSVFPFAADEPLDSGEVLEVPSELYVETVKLVDVAAEEEAEASVYSITDDIQYGAYFHAEVSDFGDVYIYIPVSAAVDSFSYNSDGLPINITGSSITGYVGGTNSAQAIQFPSFGIPRYREGTGYDYEEITSWEDIDSTVVVYSNEDTFSSYNSEYWMRLCFIILVAGLLGTFLVRLFGGFRK